eukprot:GHVS01062544.1.p1 GENE.GHVS01062544.1~~GHVS01062544.1.p1  ORF type:complete len:257 (-),score=4.58 GHVS01062544.1:167-937(-)
MKDELSKFAEYRGTIITSEVLDSAISGLEMDDAVKKCALVGSVAPFLQLRVKGYYTIACAAKPGARIPTTPQHVKGFVFGHPKYNSGSTTYLMRQTDKRRPATIRKAKFVKVTYYLESRPCDIVIRTKLYDEIRKSTDIELRWTSSVLLEAFVYRSLDHRTATLEPVLIVAAFCQHQLMTGSGSKKVFAEIISVMFQETSSYKITKTEDGLKCAKFQPENVERRDGIQFVFDGVDGWHVLCVSSHLLKEITDHVLK